MDNWKSCIKEAPQSRRRVLIKLRQGKTSVITEGWYSTALGFWFVGWGQAINRANIIAWAEKPQKG
jgi:hypothetical protein